GPAEMGKPWIEAFRRRGRKVEQQMVGKIPPAQLAQVRLDVRALAGIDGTGPAIELKMDLARRDLAEMQMRRQARGPMPGRLVPQGDVVVYRVVGEDFQQLPGTGFTGLPGLLQATGPCNAWQ